MKRLSTRLMTAFGMVILVILVVIMVLSYYNSMDALEEMSKELLYQSLENEIGAVRYYIDKTYVTLDYEDGELLDASGEVVGSHHRLVDQVKNSMNLPTTIFVKEGDDFKRVTTSIMKDDGTRAVGTYLGTDSVAYERIMNGERFLGEANILGTPYLTLYDPIISSDGEVIGIVFLGLERSDAEALIADNQQALQQLYLIVGGLSILISLALIYYISRSISNPIVRVSETLEEYANYDFTEKDTSGYENRTDEIGGMFVSLGKMRENIAQLATSMIKNADHVEVTAKDLSETTHQSSRATEEVADSINEIAKGATNQAQNTSEGSEQLRQLSQVIDEEKEAIDHLSSASKDVLDNVGVGLSIVKDLEEKTKENRKATDMVSKSIEKTNDSSNQISEASALIASIAEQTNLLALNAAIEAARAGEHGKGFAVVADEIRILAEQSTQATKSIDEVIKTLLSDAKAAVEKMNEAAEILSSQEQSVAQTKDKFTEINASVSEFIALMDQIDAGSQRVSANKDEVEDVIETLSAVAEENAASTEEASASIEEQSASLQEIASASEGLSELASDLKDLISRFKI